MCAGLATGIHAVNLCALPGGAGEGKGRGGAPGAGAAKVKEKENVVVAGIHDVNLSGLHGCTSEGKGIRAGTYPDSMAAQAKEKESTQRR
jgi:hypothetical protein